nr:cytochrome P450 monooxygenase CYP6TA1 [Lasioderma serricorne]
MTISTSLLLSYIIFYTTCAIVFLAITIYAYFLWSYRYWSRRNVPQVSPRIPMGNFGRDPSKPALHAGVRLKDFYDTAKSKGYRHLGIYMFASPFYMPIDPEIIKDIIIKDFQYFTDRGLYQNERDEPLSGHLIAMGGNKWRKLRKSLTPTFTSAKMKMMFASIVECSRSLVETVSSVSDTSDPLDCKEVLSCFTTDVIGCCAFGLDCNSFKEPDAAFRRHGRLLFEMTRTRQIKRLFSFAFPDLARFLRMKIMNPDVTEFFTRTVKETVEYRGVNNVRRNDFMQLLIDLRDEEGRALTVGQIAAQAFAFFVAGFETSSMTMAFALYELAKNESVQWKAREEIERVLDGKGLSFEAIQEMVYLDNILEETLRMYPPLPMLNRECIKDYEVKDVGLKLEKGTRLIIPILALQNDPDYFSDPEKFNPDRFNEENRKTIHTCTYLPFGEGPRNCIGSRFGLLQSKVGLAVLLKEFEFSVNQKTKEPLKMAARGSVLSAEGGIWLDVTRAKRKVFTKQT